MFGGAGDDTIVTGAGRNGIFGGGGADSLESGAGRDIFYFNAASELTGAAHDLITDFDFKRDIFSGEVTGTDQMVTTGNLRSDHFDHDLKKAVDAAHLDVGHAVLFHPTKGNYVGDYILVIDANGVAGYQAGLDFVIQMHNPDNVNLFSVNTWAFH